MTGRVALKIESEGVERSRQKEMPRLIWPIIHLFGTWSLILVSTRGHKGKIAGSRIGQLRITIA